MILVAPKRKRYNREQRLKAAKKWIPTYEGKNLVKGYSKWFGVDKVCAITELEMLGHKIDSKYKKQILKQHKAITDKGTKQKKELKPWQDRNYYYIVGYTSGGAPYGITWEEYERDIKENNDDSTKEDNPNETNSDHDGEIPF